LVSLPVFGNDTSMQPPEPSYSDQWAQMDDGSSPFLDLRNEDTQVAEPESPTVDTVAIDGETVPVTAESDTDDEMSEEKSDTQNPRTKTTETDTEGRDRDDAQADRATDTGGTGTIAAVDDSVSADTESTGETEATPSPADEVVRSEDQPETDPNGAGETTAASPSTEEPVPSDDRRARNGFRGRTETLFELVRPREPGAVLQSAETIAGTIPSLPSQLGSLRGDTVLLSSVSQPGREVPFWWRYYGWIAGGLVVSVMIGMFFWFRRRRVEVIETSQAPTGDFFQEQLQRRKPSTLDDQIDRKESGEVSTQTRTSTSQEDRSGPEYQALVEKMRNEGLNGHFEEVLELYYEKGLNEDEIAERTSRGLGEVGLVIDYADRLRKDMNYGKRA
jgi:hypothetical protein